MNDFLPGTTIELDNKREVSAFLSSLFAAGGLVLSQVLSLTGLNMHTVQNWVKRKYVSHPVNKKYDSNQFCTIVILNMLGNTFLFEDIKRLIDYVEVTDEQAPVLIYTCFVEALAGISEEKINTISEAFSVIKHTVSSKRLNAETENRLIQSTEIIMLAHFSAVRKNEAQGRLNALDI